MGKLLPFHATCKHTMGSGSQIMAVPDPEREWPMERIWRAQSIAPILRHSYQGKTVMGRLESCLAATNCSMASWKGLEILRLCRKGRTTVVLPPTTSSCRADARLCRSFLDRSTRRLFTAVNGRRSSNHWSFSYFQSESEYGCLMNR
jgi:hypothetical protein